MSSDSSSFPPIYFRYFIWLIGVSFVLFQFFLQLSSGVIIGAIMQEMSLAAWQVGILASSFYYIYTALQIPVGILFDRKNTSRLLASTSFLCAIGCFCFANSHSLGTLILSRILIGASSAFAFIGLSHLLREHFPLKQFGFLIGLSETLGFLATVFGMLGMGKFIHEWGWRHFIQLAGFMGLIIAFFCFQFIPSSLEKKSSYSIQDSLLAIFKNGQAWINGIFVGLSFTVITVFGAMWAVPFIQIKLSCSLNKASSIDSMIFLGAALSCPLFGMMASWFRRRKILMFTSCFLTAGIILFLIYYPTRNSLFVGFLMFSIGVCCGAYMLAFSIANELGPKNSLSTCTGFTNTLAMLSAPLFQPIVGLILDMLHPANQNYSLVSFQKALLVVPFCLLIACCLIVFLKENRYRHPI